MCEPPAKRFKPTIFEGIISNEIWAIVFSFLDSVSLARVSRVCYTWASLASHPELWKSLCYPYDDERLLKHPSATWKLLCAMLYKVPASQNAIIKTVSIIKQCEVCNTPATQRCSICKSIYYCGVHHQLQDFKEHKQICNSTPFIVHSSLEKALGKFRLGDSFYLCRGTYTTTTEIEIAMPVNLVGLGGDSSQVKILHQGQSWSVMVVVGCKFDISGVTVMHNSLMLPGHCLTTLKGATVEVADCVFTNMSRTNGLGSIGGATCVNICEGSNATIKNCEIVNTRKHGIYVGEGAQAVIENNTIHKVHASGIYVVSEGQAAIRRNKIYDCANHGVLVGNDGMAEVVYNEIRNVRGMGVRVLREDAETNPLLIKDNKMVECLAEESESADYPVSTANCSIM